MATTSYTENGILERLRVQWYSGPGCPDGRGVTPGVQEARANGDVATAKISRIGSRRLTRLGREFLSYGSLANVSLVLVAHYTGVKNERLVTAALAGFVVYMIAMGASLVLYRLAFHPLRKYPGPLLGKLTRFLATYHVWAWDYHDWLQAMHEKYGEAVRISPNEIAFTSITSVDVIHGAQAGKMARGPFYEGDPNRPADSMLSTRSLYEHRWRRKGWERGFGSYQLKHFEPRVKQHLQTLTAQLKTRAGTAVDMTAWAEFFAYDVMSDLAFSEDFGMLRAGEKVRMS